MSDVMSRLAAALDDRYDIVRELGAGGMATVYLADDRKHQRQVAVKVLRPELAAVIGAERFLSEIRTTAKLQHPHILPLFDSGEVDGLLFYVMPFVDGESLRQRITRETQLPIPDVVRIASEIASGLDYAHRNGVIHRDIKPENILLHEGAAFIADFGIALAASSVGSSRMTETGMSLGTPHYMSPEQAMGQRDITASADVYALGAVTYEMLVGEPPFTGPTAQAIVAKVITTNPLAPRVLRNTIPQPMNDAVLTALAKIPADRFSNTAKFAEALRSTEVVAPREASSTRQPTRLRPLAIGAVVLLVIVSLALAARSRLLSNERHVVTRTRAFTTDLGLFLDPSLSPDGKLIAYAAGQSSRMRLYVRARDGGREIPLTDSMPGRQRWPRWSPDGSKIAFMATGIGIAVVPSLGGPVRVLLTDQPGRPVHSPAWSPDGKQLAYAVGPTIRVRTLESGSDTVVATIGAVATGARFLTAFQLAWSPDGQWIAAATGGTRFAFGGADLGTVSPTRIVVASVGTGRVVKITGDALAKAMELSPVWTADGRHLLFVSTRDGGRDVYEVALSSTMEPDGEATRLTTGLNVHSISLSADDRTLAYSTYQPAANIWSIPIPRTGEASVSSGRELTHTTELIEDVDVSPDGTTLVFTSNRSGNSDLYRMSSGGGPATQLTADSTGEFGPVWSPDGREILYGSRRGDRTQLKVLSADGGSTQLAADVPRSRGHDWSFAGKEIVFSGSTRQREPLMRVTRAPSGWSAAQGIPGTEGGVGPRVAPDGSAIAFLIGDPITKLAVIASSDGTPTVLLTPSMPPGMTQFLQPVWSRDSRSIYFTLGDTTGASGIWSASPTTGATTRVVRFDNSDLQTGGRFGVDSQHFYVRLIRHTGTIGTAELTRR